MQDFPRLSHAPILEAVIEVRVATERPVPPASFDRSVEALKAEFPVSQQIRHLTATLMFGPDGKSEQQTDSNAVGVRVESADRVEVIQMRPDLLAVSRVRLYSHWPDLIGLMARVWHLYVDAVVPKAVHRIGVRFINHIEIKDGEELDQILTAGPRVPDGLPQTILGFNSRVVVPMGPQECVVAIAQGVEIPQLSAEALQAPQLILDIDAFSDVSMPPDWEKIAPKLESLRIAKNMAFFNSLGSRVIERLK